MFRRRLFVGLAPALVGLAVLDPLPFFRAGSVPGIAAIVVGLAVRAWGAGCAGLHTRSARIEAPRLITGGPYAHVRNPIYCGTICIGLGMAALLGDPLAFVLSAIAFVILYATIVPAEEAFLREQFRAGYDEYCRAVPRLIPRLGPWSGRTRAPFQWRATLGELRIALLLVAIYGAFLFKDHLAQRGRPGSEVARSPAMWQPAASPR
ncbi:MAG: isoprenylcysteine carboxylmethyltransferase family protein [Chthoniobacteraceae bacterium]